jgi:hypothetical protein
MPTNWATGVEWPLRDHAVATKNADKRQVGACDETGNEEIIEYRSHRARRSTGIGQTEWIFGHETPVYTSRY